MKYKSNFNGSHKNVLIFLKIRILICVFVTKMQEM